MEPGHDGLEHQTDVCVAGHEERTAGTSGMKAIGLRMTWQRIEATTTTARISLQLGLPAITLCMMLSPTGC
jgi:hypothetical protein